MFIVVRVEGLEPPCLAAPDPKSGMSTNFTTPAEKFQRSKVPEVDPGASRQKPANAGICERSNS